MMLSEYELFASRFPESFWPFPIDRCHEYNKQIYDGLTIMLQKTCCICGLARNLGNRKVYHAMSRLVRLANMFNDFKIIIYTNDNDDNTADELYEWAEEDSRITILKETLNKPMHGSVETQERYTDMAYYRNQYLNEIRRIAYHPNILCVVDLDVDGFSYEGVAHSFSLYNKWSAIGANGILYKDNKRLHYDSLAFRRSTQPFNKKHNSTEINQLNYNRGDDIVRVRSCFGGIMFYRYIAVHKLKYEASDTMCDHVSLHQQMYNNGYDTIYLNPNMICLYGINPYTL